MTEGHPFFGYAYNHWVHHSQQCELNHDITPEAVVQFLLRSTSFPLRESLGLILDHYNGLHLASRYGIVECLPRLLERFDVNAPTKSLKKTALILASESGQNKVIGRLLDVPVLQVNAIGWKDTGIPELILNHPEVNMRWSKKKKATPLMRAARYGHMHLLERLLKMQVNVNEENSWGETALYWAISSNQVNFATKMLSVPGVNIAVVDRDGKSLLMNAAQQGSEQLVELLLSTGQLDVNAIDDRTNTALIYAGLKGSLPVVKRLLAAEDIDPNMRNDMGETAILCAARHGHVETVDHLLDHPIVRSKSDGPAAWALLMAAVKGGDDEMVDRVLRLPTLTGDAQDETAGRALGVAARRGSIGIVARLLVLPNIDINVADAQGQTPLISASQAGHIRVVELLLADPRTEVKALDNAGNNAPLAASMNCHWHIVLLLLGHIPAVDINIVDGMGRTLLVIAAHHGQEAVVKVLLGFSDIQVNIVSICGAPDLRGSPRRECKIIPTSNVRGALWLDSIKARTRQVSPTLPTDSKPRKR
jgi:ankyrin repeat domain-containing protein 50